MLVVRLFKLICSACRNVVACHGQSEIPIKKKKVATQDSNACSEQYLTIGKYNLHMLFLAIYLIWVFLTAVFPLIFMHRTVKISLIAICWPWKDQTEIICVDTLPLISHTSVFKFRASTTWSRIKKNIKIIFLSQISAAVCSIRNQYFNRCPRAKWFVSFCLKQSLQELIRSHSQMIFACSEMGLALLLQDDLKTPA